MKRNKFLKLAIFTLLLTMPLFLSAAVKKSGSTKKTSTSSTKKASGSTKKSSNGKTQSKENEDEIDIQPSNPMDNEKMIEVADRKWQLYMASQEYFKNGRFGNKNVGFIAYPQGEEWILYTGMNETPTAMQIIKEGTDIFTLDSVEIKNKGISPEQLAMNALNSTAKKYTGSGKSHATIEKNPLSINEYKGQQMTIRNISGKTVILNAIIFKDRVYLVTVEGKPENVKTMLDLVIKSWNPEM
jgi:hypothetical protein